LQAIPHTTAVAMEVIIGFALRFMRYLLLLDDDGFHFIIAAEAKLQRRGVLISAGLFAYATFEKAEKEVDITLDEAWL
jgi:hypothetical protein